MAHHIHPIPGDLYRKTDPIQEDMPKVQGYNFNQGVDYRATLQSYLNTGLQATNVGKAIQQINKMVFADASIVFPLLVAETFATHANKMTPNKENE